jgi:hypothetical protein
MPFVEFPNYPARQAAYDQIKLLHREVVGTLQPIPNGTADYEAAQKIIEYATITRTMAREDDNIVQFLGNYRMMLNKNLEQAKEIVTRVLP